MFPPQLVMRPAPVGWWTGWYLWLLWLDVTADWRVMRLESRHRVHQRARSGEIWIAATVFYIRYTDPLLSQHSPHHKGCGGEEINRWARGKRGKKTLRFFLRKLFPLMESKVVRIALRKEDARNINKSCMFICSMYIVPKPHSFRLISFHIYSCFVPFFLLHTTGVRSHKVRRNHISWLRIYCSTALLQMPGGIINA